MKEDENRTSIVDAIFAGIARLTLAGAIVLFALFARDSRTRIEALEAVLSALQSPEPALPPAIRDGCKAEVWEPSGGSKSVVR